MTANMRVCTIASGEDSGATMKSVLPFLVVETGRDEASVAPNHPSTGSIPLLARFAIGQRRGARVNSPRPGVAQLCDHFDLRYVKVLPRSCS